MSATDRNPVTCWPSTAKATRASAGNSNLTVMPTTQVPSVELAIAAGPKPHDENIAYDTPTATAPPTGTVMATVVDDWQTTAACRRDRPGIDSITTGQ